MEHNPLDLEAHEEETWWDVWKRRVMFIVLIALCVTFAAPSFSTCTGSFEGGAAAVARFEVGGRTVQMNSRQVNATRNHLHMARKFLLTNARSLRYYGLDPNVSDDSLWSHIMLDAAAVESGLHVSKDEVGRRLMRDIPQLTKDGAFDEGLYRSMIAPFLRDASHKDMTRTLQEIYRVQEYERLLLWAVQIIPSEDAYANWKSDNVRLSVDYLVQPFGPLEKEFAEKTPDEDALEKFIGVKDEYRVPPGKIIEAAYVKIADVTDEQYAKLVDAVFAKGLLDAGDDRARALNVVLFDHFYQLFTDKRVYTPALWRTWKRGGPAYQKALKKYEADLAAWELIPEDERKDAPTKPDDPGANPWAEGASASQVLLEYWTGYVGREVLGAMILEEMARRSETEQKSFADLLPEYAPLGVALAVNTKPLTRDELAEGFPGGLAKDNEFTILAHNTLRGPGGDATFTPEVHTTSFPMTQFEKRVLDRGAMVIRLAGYEKSRPRNIEEVRAQATADWREYQVTTRARDLLLEAHKAIADGGKTLAEAAAEKGLPVRSLREFNSTTEKRRPPSLPTEGDVDPAVRKVHDDIRFENYVMDRYGILNRLEVGAFAPGAVQLDGRRTKAAYLMQIAAKRDPSPLEMDPVSLETAKRGLQGAIQKDLLSVLGKEALAKRFKLEMLETDDDKADDEDPEETAGGE